MPGQRTSELLLMALASFGIDILIFQATLHKVWDLDTPDWAGARVFHSGEKRKNMIKKTTKTLPLEPLRCQGHSDPPRAALQHRQPRIEVGEVGAGKGSHALGGSWNTWREGTHQGGQRRVSQSNSEASFLIFFGV